MKSEQIFKSFVIFVNGKTIKPIDMKQKIIVLGLATLLLCGCGSTYQATSTLAGASIGGNVGGAIGGLVGSNRHWDGGYRGSAIGTLVGTLAGAAIGGAISSAQERKAQERKAQEGYPVEKQHAYTPQPNDIPSSVGYLQIRNIRFIDENRNHIIELEEHSKVIFEIINTSHETVYNAVPIVQTDNKRIYVSPSVMLEQIAPHEGIKYTAHIRGGKRLKDGEVIIHIAIADYEGREYDWQEFTLPTRR